eukprot:11191313-Karenia_brevis.AAC.1
MLKVGKHCVSACRNQPCITNTSYAIASSCLLTSFYIVDVGCKSKGKALRMLGRAEADGH